MSDGPNVPDNADQLPSDGIRFPLALRLAPAAVHAPAAWFVPGDSPAAWIDELFGWGVPMADLRLYVLPAADRRAGRAAVGRAGAEVVAASAAVRGARRAAIRAG